MKNIILTILLSLLLLTPLQADCIWTDPVKIAGDGTGDIIPVPTVSPESADICDAGRLYCMIMVTNEDGVIKYIVLINHEPQPYFFESNGGWGVLVILVEFPDEPDTYCSGDTWTFELQ